MAYPKENTAEWWDLIASGYRQLLADPPKFIIPGIDRDTQYAEKIKEAEDRATELRLKENMMPFISPTKEVIESLERREAEMNVFGSEAFHQDYSYNAIPERECVIVTEDVWKEVFKLN
jgi:hypothetical protein